VLVTVASFVFVLSLLVFVHEAGHFAAAKLAGIRVLRFSFGFGKVLLHFHWRGTEYALSMLPLGGYVKMAGGDDAESTGAPDEFLSKPPWVRMVVAAAGPAMNIVLAILLYAAVAKAGYTMFTFPNRVGGVLETVRIGERDIPAPALAAGFREGDVIVAVDGRATKHWFELQQYVNDAVGRPVVFNVKRNGHPARLVATPLLEPDSGRGMIGLMPYQSPQVYLVATKSAAGKAGVAKGDRLAACNGRPLSSFTELVSIAMAAKPGQYDVSFAGVKGAKVARVDYRQGGAEAFLEALGVDCGIVEVKRSSTWLGAVPEGARQTWDVVKGTARAFSWLVKGEVKVTKALGGPITMARVAGATARAGAVTFFTYIGYLSVMLGMLNLLPVPVLDGGHILIASVETVRRKRLPARAREIVTVVGLAVIVGITLLALFVDVNRFIHGGGMP